MERHRTPRRRPEAPSAPTTLHEITRRYYACAVALARAMGVPMSETFLREHRESISCCFIEAGRAGVRLPPAVPLPPLTGPPAASAPGHAPAPEASPPLHGHTPEPPRSSDAGESPRLTQDQARALKQLALVVFGYPEGERRLRHDLGFEPEEKLTLRHLSAHITVEQYQTLMDGYEAILRQEQEADVPG